MNELLQFKKRAVAEFIRRKETLLNELKGAQRSQAEDAQTDDIDFADIVESPREQMADEVSQKTESIDFISEELAILKSIQVEEEHDVVSKGSLVHTNVSYFLVGVAQEQFAFENKKLMGISMNAPVFLKMQGLKKKTEFHYGNTEYVILDIA